MILSGRTVLVTGGTSGIGLGIAAAFYKAGSRVVVCGRNPEKLSAVASQFPGIATIRCDVGDAEEREALAEEVLGNFPELDILVNNAGIQRYIDLKKGYDDLKSGEDEISMNFVSLVEITSLFIRRLLDQSSAAIINISSGLGFMPMLKTPIYNATKAAIHTYTLVLRQQLENTSVKVFEVVPPMVDTDLNREGRNRASLKYRGISVADYIPSVIQGLEDDLDVIFYGDGAKVLSEPRGEIETSLLNSDR